MSTVSLRQPLWENLNISIQKAQITSFFRFQSGKLGGKDRFLKKLRNRDVRLRDRFYKNRGIPTISGYAFATAWARNLQ